MAPRSKLTPALTKTFAQAMEDGMYQADAAALIGVVPSTVYRWYQRGQQALEDAAAQAAALPEDERPDDTADLVPAKERPFADFWRRASAAEAKAIQANLLIIQTAAHSRDDIGDWRAAAWFLEHRRPDSWGERRAKHEHAGTKGGAPITVSIVQFGEEDLGGGGNSGTGN